MAGAPKKRIPRAGFTGPKDVQPFSEKGVRKPVRATYYGKKAR